MPTPEAPPEIPKKMTNISGFPKTEAEKLENDPDLLRVLYTRQENGKERIVAILKEEEESKGTISMGLWDCLTEVGRATGLPWTCIPVSREEDFTSGSQIVSCLFESSPNSQK